MFRRSRITMPAAGLFLTLLVATPALAQSRPGRGAPERGPDRRIEALDRRLDLSDAQAVEIRAILARAAETHRAWRASNPDVTREAARTFMSAHREATHAAIAAMLTPDQAQRFGEVPRPGERRRNVRDGRRFGRAPAMAAQGLDLTETQREAVKTLVEQRQEAFQAWRASQPDATREARQAFHREQAAAFQAAFVALLTPEQAERYRTFTAERRDRRQDRRDRRGLQRGDRRGNGGAAQRAPDAAAARVFDLSNYPNPFNPTTEIRFSLPEAANVTLTVYDVQGREVGRLLDGRLDAGAHTATFTAEGLPTGTYVYRLVAGGMTETGRMVLMK